MGSWSPIFLSCQDHTDGLPASLLGLTPVRGRGYGPQQPSLDGIQDPRHGQTYCQAQV